MANDSKSKREKIMLWILALCLISYLFLPDGIDRVSEYTPPPLSKLKVSTGIVTFHDGWKGRGGELIVETANEKIIINCVPPNYAGGFPCSYKKTENGTLDFKAEVEWKVGTAWWEPTYNPGSAKGRLYQLEVDKKMVLPYEYMSAEYMEYFKKSRKK